MLPEVKDFLYANSEYSHSLSLADMVMSGWSEVPDYLARLAYVLSVKRKLSKTANVSVDL